MPRFRPPGLALTLLLAAILLLGLARVAMLPPFEGFDESGHYSYVGQLATRGTWPRRGDAMAAEIDNYIAVAPTSPSMRRTRTYADLAAASDAERAAARAFIHGTTPKAPWAPGTIGNWEAQHPPLYYAILAPAYRLAADWSLAGRLLLLRSLSYVMAWCGLGIAAYAAVTASPTERPEIGAVAATLLWPVLLPEWFPEMARVGNDSLLVPLAGLTWLALRRAIADGRLVSALQVGVVIGLGLLTKATFLPLAVAAVLVLTAAALASPRPRHGLAGVLTCGGAVLAVAGWWYGGQIIATGDPIGANDSINLAQGGGLWNGLRQHAAVGTLLRMFGTFDLSMVWDGSWSFVIPPLVTVVPMMVIVPLMGALGLRDRWGRWSRLETVAPLTFALFTVALIYYSLVLIAGGGTGQPAWYLHAFVPALWPLLAWGFAAALRRPVLRLILPALIVYAAVFLLTVTLCDAALFAGCAVPVGNARYFAPVQVIGCLADPVRIAAGLDLLAYPALAAILFIPGAVCLVAGVALLSRRLIAPPDRGWAPWSVSPASP